MLQQFQEFRYWDLLTPPLGTVGFEFVVCKV